MRLSVAGLELDIATREAGISCVPNPLNPEYRDFLRPTGVGPPDIRVEVVIGCVPPALYHPLNDDEQGTHWFSDQGRRRVVTRDAFQNLHFDCLLDADFRRAEVFLSDSKVRREAGGSVVDNPVVYPLDQCLLMYHMAARQGVMLHAAGAFHQGRCALFLGRSGAGKSTVSRQLLSRSGFRMGSDDRMIVRKGAAGHAAFGTPWPGEARIARNEGAPLGGLFFLHKAPENRMVPLKPQAAFERLLPVASIPWFDPAVYPAVLETLERLAAQAPAFDLYFKPTPEVADELDRLLRSVHGS